jgi:hypothetical protein
MKNVLLLIFVAGCMVATCLLIFYAQQPASETSAGVHSDSLRNAAIQDTATRVIQHATNVKNEITKQYVTNITNIYNGPSTADQLDSILGHLYDSLYTYRFSKVITQ